MTKAIDFLAALMLSEEEKLDLDVSLEIFLTLKSEGMEGWKPGRYQYGGLWQMGTGLRHTS